MSDAWYWDPRKRKRRRYRPSASNWLQIGGRGFAIVAALAVGGAVVIAVWDTTIGIVLAVLGVATWWGVEMVRELRSLEGRTIGRIPDYTVTPAQAARMEHGENVAGAFGLGGGGDSGGGGGS